MDTLTISFISGEHDLDTESRLTSCLQSKEINLKPLRDAFSEYITQYRANTLADLRFNFYKLIGIPDNSYIKFSLQPLLNSELVYQVFNPSPEVFGTARLDPSHSIFFKYRSDNRLTDKHFPGRDTNKIHLQVKHEYILHCILKILPLADLFPEYSFVWKVNPWNRDSNTRPRDYVLRAANHGVAATFVIYGSSDAEIMRRLLVELVRLFPNEAEMGLMDVRYTNTLTAGHVRLNHMISYAGSDRGLLINRIKANMAKFPDAPTVLPPWISRMAAACTTDTMADINKDSQLYIGRDVCDAEGKPIDYQEICNKPPRFINQAYCYMPAELLNPRNILSGGSRKSRRKTRRNSRNRRQRQH
jgi:hypothetical protein